MFVSRITLVVSELCPKPLAARLERIQMLGAVVLLAASHTTSSKCESQVSVVSIPTSLLDVRSTACTIKLSA